MVIQVEHPLSEISWTDNVADFEFLWILGKKLYIAFMDLENAYDWQAVWDVLRIYGVGEKLLNAMKSFCEDASACVKISGETSEHFEIKVGMRQGCHVTIVVYLYGW